MQHAHRPLRRIAGLVACVLVLFGTTGASALDALVHAGHGHAGHHENSHQPGPQDSDCVLCVAAAPMAASPTVPCVLALPTAVAGSIAPGATRAPHATTYYLTPPGRGPPSA